MNGLLWTFSLVLAIIFLMTGSLKVFGYDAARNRLTWVGGLPRASVILIGIVEILAALGLVLPALTGIYPWLTSTAAICLSVLMLAAGAFHMLRREYDEVLVSVLLFVLALFVAYGRLELVPLG